jgi:predicted metal-binding membrane protein
LAEADPDALERLPWRRPTALLALAPLSLLASLVVLSGAAWALTLYHALGMNMPRA